jgi:organic hydroperoxide reductase OsmC/OhrA
VDWTIHEKLALLQGHPEWYALRESSARQDRKEYAAMSKTHVYHTNVMWTGNTGAGTSDYRAYSRSHKITAKGKPAIPGSSDPAFRGDPSRYNPEELLLAALSTCHMLWYLHLCADNGIVVESYMDRAEATLAEFGDGSGRFTDALLKPEVVIRTGGDPALARSLHERAHQFCFIANSVNFPVRCEASVTVE